jgi:hypothetical protein
MRKLLLAACLCVLMVPPSRLDAQTATPAGDGETTRAPVSADSASATVFLTTDDPTVPAPPAGVVGPIAASISFLGQGNDQGQQAPEKRSPWMLLPVVSSGPKMGTSFGFLGSYLHYFDPKSQVSMFGLMYEYSTTKSQVGAVFARTSFKEDSQRLEGIVAYAYVRNEYKDYMGTGQTFKTTDEALLGAGRYLYRVKGPWFVGAEAVFGSYSMEGETDLQNKILNILGLAGVHMGGVGLVMMHDSRDNQDMPVSGWYANLNWLANRDALGADEDFDTTRLEVKGFIEHGKGHVFAVRQNNQWTHEAPASAESTVEVRGYKMQQYLGKHMASIEGEERLRFSRRWGATLFGGTAYLYGSGDGKLSSDGWYPFGGAGIQFIVKPEDHMLLNLEFAHGNLNNYGIYLKFAYAW